jgi:hypothetical protein
MSAKYEIKTLEHNMESSTRHEDAELAGYLNEGWEIVPSLSATLTVIRTFGESDEHAYSVPIRYVTLRRELPSLSELSTKALQRLNKLICKEHSADSNIGIARRQWVNEDLNESDFLTVLKRHEYAMSEKVKQALQVAIDAHKAYQASLEDDE